MLCLKLTKDDKICLYDQRTKEKIGEFGLDIKSKIGFALISFDFCKDYVILRDKAKVKRI